MVSTIHVTLPCRACADIAIVRDDGSADATPAAVPEEPSPTDEDYNEVDTDRQQHHITDDERPNYAGHVVALSLACVLLPLLLLLVILYFYCARDKLRNLCRRHARCWNKTSSGSETALDDDSHTTSATKAEKNLDGGSKLEFHNHPYNVAPRAPPRRHRRNSSSSSATSPGCEDSASTSPNPV